MLVNGCHKKISVLTLCLLIIHYANCLPKERENRHLFPLLGYLHGYKIGQNFAYQLPPFVLSPVVILPSVNQQQSVNVQKSTAGENYQENGGTFQIISPSRLISNFTEATYKDNDSDEAVLKRTSKIDILEKLNLPLKPNPSSSDQDTFRQVITNDTDVTTVKSTETDNETVTLTTDVTDDEVENLKSTTQLQGPYPTAVYTNDNISTLSITTASLQINNSTSPVPLLQYNLTLPSMENNQNFSKPNLGNNNKEVKSSENNYPKVTVPTSFRGYSYRNPWYNPVADKLSITTDSYTNYKSPLPLAYDDRWQSFPSLRKSYPTSEFRPVAGLYHDGFLHKPLIRKTGFIPLNSKYLYYN
ncbi:uncharacterized protein LOC123872673 [Maniola jurtina]|uniref:uncharacterized protein LOC123872673 n=1 Tax=Maniola jurtina TaxID=191418 RepID=UPI001E6892C7|nr:uncharacterized protein LOC123872673 [Maniola jurtina]